MKKFFLNFLLLLGIIGQGFGQCDMQNYSSTAFIPPAAFPYTNGNGITVNAALVTINQIQNFTYSCGGNVFNTSTPAWWINSAAASITLTFSQPVCNLTVVINGTNTTEEMYFNANNGFCNIVTYCTANFVVTGGGNGLLCTQTPAGATGTIITVDNPAGATQYVITHNGLAAGSRVTLLDCYVGCNPPPNNTITTSVPQLVYCAGDSATVNYTATGTFNPGNVFTAQLSNAAGSFAAPTVIGSVASVTSGSIPCVIPPGTPTGTGYRIRVVSNNPFVTGTDNGANITVNGLPNVTANASPQSVCQGGNLTLSGGGAATYVWTSPVQDGVPFVPAATAGYTVTGTDANGCSNTASINVPVNPLPAVTATAAPPDLCAGASTTLSGGGASTYAWTGGATNNVAFTPAATATYTVTGTDANGCTGTSSVTVTVNAIPVLTLSVQPNDTICAGTSITLTASGAASYAWTGGIQNGVAFSPAGTATYTVTGTSGANCSATLAQTITVNPQPSVNLGPDLDLCTGDSVILDATFPGASYLWFNGGTGPQFTAKATGSPWVQVSIGPCIASDTVKVTVNTYPVVNLGVDTSICEGQSLTLNAACPGCSYLWDDNSTTPTRTVNQAGQYYVTTTRNGCSSADSLNLAIRPLPVVDLGPDTTMCKGDIIELDVYRPGATYLWQDLTLSPKYKISDFGTYWVQVTYNGCTGQDDLIVSNSNQCNCPVIVPNAFSPNGDLRNDVFRLVNIANISLTQFSIFNRYGEEVFSSTNPTVGWEGNHKGQPCDVGTYYFVVRYKCLYTGKDFLLKGDVTLVR